MTCLFVVGTSQHLLRCSGGGWDCEVAMPSSCLHKDRWNCWQT